jgi:hypothetical protein
MLRSFTPAALAFAVLLSGCTFGDSSDENERNASRDSAARQAGPPPAPALLLEVDIASRQLNVYRDNRVVASHPVAVGSAEWPTPTGQWDIGQVIFNPRWVPPEESWAEDEEIAEPGAPDNPLGKVQLVYSPPNSIHGTNEPESLGQAVSHGSIRIANDDGVEVARMVMQAGGAPRDDAFVQNALANPTERVEVVIPNPVPIRVVAGPVQGVPALNDSTTTDSAAAAPR